MTLKDLISPNNFNILTESSLRVLKTVLLILQKLSHQYINTDSSFEKVAQSYSNQMGKNGDINHETNLDPSIFRLLGDAKDATIYDIGCGNGYLEFKLLEMGAGMVYASDISPSLIDMAKNRAELEQISGLRFHVNDAADFSHLEGLDEFFDLAISNVAVHYIKDLDKLAAGLQKILISGGKFVFSVGHPVDDFAFHKELPREDLVLIAQAFLEPYSQTVYWGEENLIEIQKRPISYYISVFTAHGYVLTAMEELPKTYTDKSGTLQKVKFPGFVTYCFTKV